MSLQRDKKVLFENSIAIALTQIVSYVIPLVSLPYLSRVLGVEKFGIVFWAQSCIMYFRMFTEYGFNFSAVRKIAVNHNNKQKISNIFNAVMGVKLILIVISLIFLTLLIFTIPKFRSEWLLFYLTFFLVIGDAIYPMWYFQGIEHMKYVTFSKIISQLIFLLLIFIFVKSPADYLLVAVLNSLGFLVAGGIGIYMAIKRFNLKLAIPSMENVISEFKYSTEFFFANASSSLYTNTNSFVLGLVASPLFVGYYVAAEKIFQAVHNLTAPVGVALYPYISKTKNVPLYKKIFYIMSIIMLFSIIIIWLISPQLIKTFYGIEMLPAYKTLRIFCITVLFSSISGLIGYPLVAAMGYTKLVNRSLSVAAFLHINVLGLLYILGKLNITTIAYLTILPYATMLTIRVYGIIKYKLWSYKLKEEKCLSCSTK